MKTKAQKPLFIASAPSGCGKDTLIAKVLERWPWIRLSVSYTTRKPRQDKKTGRWEVDGVDYHFISSEEEFFRMRDAGMFLECGYIHGAWYATGREALEALRAECDAVILNIEGAGMRQVKAACPNAVSIFVMPPSRDALLQRLVARGSETMEKCLERVNDAARQMQDAPEYDYLVLNDDLDAAVEQVCAIIEETMRRSAAQSELFAAISETF